MNASTGSGAEGRSFFDFVWEQDGRRPGSVRVGTADTVKEEMLRFHSTTSMGYPARQMERVWWERDDRGRERCHVRLSFFGLTGVTSPLPVTYLRDILDDEDEGAEPKVSPFLDIFNHRLTSLYYRSWLKYRGHMRLAHGERGGVAALLLALGGFDSALPGVRDKPEALLPVIAPFTNRVRSASCSEDSLRELLGAPVTVVAYDLRQVPVPEQQRFRLGVSACCLNGDDPPVLGEYVPDYMGRCEIRLGPLPKSTFDLLRPEGELLGAVHRVLAHSLPTTLEYRLTLILDPDAAEDWPIGDQDSIALGINSWLGEPAGTDCELPAPAQIANTLPHLRTECPRGMAGEPSELTSVPSN